MPSVVIIGHGSSPIGCGWGHEIDKRIVVRMKEPSWQNEADYGRRTDYQLASTETMLTMLETKRIPKEYWAQPKRGYWSKETEASFRQRAKAPLIIPLDVHRHWNPIFLSLSEKTPQECGNHSLGMAAITYTCALLGPSEILLVGFDNMLDPDRLDYMKANKGKWVSRHAWHAENRMLPLVERHYNVKIRNFALRDVNADQPRELPATA